MAKDVSPKALGTEAVLWDLADYYTGPDDAAIAADMETLTSLMVEFETTFKGQLGKLLGPALSAYADISKWASKLYGYCTLAKTRDTSNDEIQRVCSRIEETLAASMGKHTTFFELEVARLEDSQLAAQAGDAVVAKHMPMLLQIRKLGAHYLEEAVEQSLALRSPFGPAEWSDMMDELESQLQFDIDGKTVGLAEGLHDMTESRDPERRARLMEVINKGLKNQRHTYLYARTLNVVAGNNLANDAARGFRHPMEATNLNNMVDDATVDALHDVMLDKGAKLAQRFYKLKARLLKIELPLRWSDRNAPMPFAPDAVRSWVDGVRIVKKAYHNFSPTLGQLVDRVIDNGWVDAPPSKTKIAGAYNATLPLPDGVRSYVLMNYLGSVDGVSTFAHELGHAVHGLLGMEEQGALMWSAPLVYAETASIFGEMLTFESLLAETTEPRERLAMYMDKMMHFMNSVLRQISFSAFEQELYARRQQGKLSETAFDALWLDVTKRFYGQDGEVFTYTNMEHMWSYISHFAGGRPFYVYAYAFGELFTQSLMATRGTVGADFEPLYLELLRAGGTKDAVALMKPFGLNPNDRSFWEKGIDGSFGVWLKEAEKLVDELGL